MSKSILSNKKVIFLIVAGITILGLYLRLIGICRTTGLWYDEIHTYSIAMEKFPFGIIDRLNNEDFHAPFYYLLMHIWVKFLGNSDVLLRILSVIFGVLTIPAIYFAGKEFDSKKTGIVAAFLICVNPFMIYYSQEVRFYSFLGLLGTLSIYFLLKIKANPNKLNYAVLITTNLLILYTHTIGIIFVFMQALVYFIYLLLKKKPEIKGFVYSQLIIFTAYLPFIPVLFHSIQVSSKLFMNYFWYSKFSYIKLFHVAYEWICPILSGLLITNKYVFKMVGISNVIFAAILPAFIYIFGIIKAVTKKDSAKLLFLIGFFCIIAEIYLSATGRLAFMSRFTIASFPILALLVSYGLCSIKNKKLSFLLISFPIIVTLNYFLLCPYSIVNTIRGEGYKIAADMLEKNPFNHDDIVIMTYGGNILDKYYKKAPVSSFDLLNIYLYPKKDRLKNVFDEKTIKILNRKNAKEVLKSFLASSEPTKLFESYFKREFVDKLKKNRYIAIVRCQEISFLKPGVLKKAVQNPRIYKEEALFYMLASKTVNDTLVLGNKYLKPVKVMTGKEWEIYIFKKP